jgi:hypothetical protein
MQKLKNPAIAQTAAESASTNGPSLGLDNRSRWLPKENFWPFVPLLAVSAKGESN